MQQPQKKENINKINKNDEQRKEEGVRTKTMKNITKKYEEEAVTTRVTSRSQRIISLILIIY